MFHRHKLGPVQTDGYQYCTKCGKAFAAPQNSCQHKWERIAVIHDFVGRDVGYTLSCTKCGEIKEYRL